MTAQRKVVAIRLPADLIEAVDETARELMLSRSRLIEYAVSEYMQRLGDRLSAGDSQTQALGLTP